MTGAGADHIVSGCSEALTASAVAAECMDGGVVRSEPSLVRQERRTNHSNVVLPRMGFRCIATSVIGHVECAPALVSVSIIGQARSHSLENHALRASGLLMRPVHARTPCEVMVDWRKGKWMTRRSRISPQSTSHMPPSTFGRRRPVHRRSAISECIRLRRGGCPWRSAGVACESRLADGYLQNCRSFVASCRCRELSDEAPQAVCGCSRRNPLGRTKWCR